MGEFVEGIWSEAIEYGPWDGGVDYSMPALDLAPNVLFEMNDTEILFGGQCSRRGGFEEYITGAFSGTPAVTALGQHRFDATDTRKFAVAGAVFYEDVSGVWTDRTGGQTITAAEDNVFVTANAAGTRILTNGVDAPLKWSAAGGNLALLDVDSRFTTALACTFWDNRAWFCNVSAGENYFWPSNSEDIETYGANAYYITDGPGTGILPVKSFLALHTEEGIWGLFPTGSSDLPYSRQQRAGFGTVSPRALVRLPDGSQMFPRFDGIYEWDGAQDPQKVSAQLEGDRFWNLVDQDRLHKSHAVVYPIKNQVHFHLPLASTPGGSQTQMNRVIIWDYRRRIWMGPHLYGRNCSAYFDKLPHAGDYAGLTWKHDFGEDDNDGKIGTAANFLTSSPAPEGIHVTNRWLLARVEFDKAATDYNVSMQQFGADVVSHTEQFAIGDPSDALVTEFTIGSSRIRGAEVSDVMDVDLWGWAPMCQLKFFNPEIDQPFSIRRVIAAYNSSSVKKKTVMGNV